MTTRTEILGVPVDSIDMPTTLDIIRRMLAGKKTNVIAAVNPEKVIAAQKNHDLLRALNNATLVIPDGIGVVAAVRILGKHRIKRVPGSDLMPEICRLAANEGYRVFLYGAKPEVVDGAATVLRQQYPKLQVAGTQHGYVPDDEMHQVIEKVNASNADVLFVGVGSPRQELWMDYYRSQLNVRICQGVGGTFDALCGNVKRAPRAFQRLHLEWFYRLLAQPQRAHRQLALPRFAWQVFRQFIGRRRMRS